MDRRGGREIADQRGAALLIVLWTVLIVSALLAGAMASARIEARIAAARIERFKAEQALLSALDLAAFEAAVGERRGGGEEPPTFELNGYAVRVEPAAESARLDVNLASEEEWTALLVEAGGLDFEAASALAARIADWRDEDDLVRPNGAEASDYRASGLQIGDRAFRSVAEIAAVLGMPPGLADCLAPHLTLFGDAGGARGRADVSSAIARAAAPGERRALIATAASAPEGRQRFARAGLFRITGGDGAPYAWIAHFAPTEPEAGSCAQDEPDRK